MAQTSPTIQVDLDGYATCPDCSTRIKCGPGGSANLEKRHRGSKVCVDTKAKRARDASKKKDGSILAFMRKKPPMVAPTVVAPPLVQASSMKYHFKLAHPLAPPTNSQSSGEKVVCSTDAEMGVEVTSTMEENDLYFQLSEVSECGPSPGSSGSQLPQVVAQNSFGDVNISLSETQMASSSNASPGSELEDDEPPIRPRTKRKAIDLGNISQCLCGQPVSTAQIQAGSDVAQCKKAGCETEWYHLSCIKMEQVSKNWVCSSCLSSGPSRVLKHIRKD